MRRMRRPPQASLKSKLKAASRSTLVFEIFFQLALQTERPGYNWAEPVHFFNSAIKFLGGKNDNRSRSKIWVIFIFLSFFFLFFLNKFPMKDHCFNPFKTWPFSEVSFHSACTWLWVLPIRTVIDFVGFVWNFFQFLGSCQNGRIFHFFFEKNHKSGPS